MTVTGTICPSDYDISLIVENRDAIFSTLVSVGDDALEGVLEIVVQRIPT